MSRTPPNRTTTRPTQMCTAFGCSLLGTMSTSTQGAPDWWCFAHFRADPGRLQRITAELRRVDWLSNAISDVRTRDHHQDYPVAFERILHDLAMANRGDLAWTVPESEEQWLSRLEAELTTILASTAVPTQKQAGLPLADGENNEGGQP